MSRFEEATAYHRAIHVLRLRDQSIHPDLTDSQRAERTALITLMCRLLVKARDEAIELGIVEWSQRET